LEILAGLLDTDGYYSRSMYWITSKYEKLADDIVFLCRSLGLAAYKKEVWKDCQSFTEKRKYFSVSIFGDCDRIPCRVKRKKAEPRKQKSSVLREHFSVKYIGKDNFYGFNLDGNNLYLLNDFTVMHNSGKTIIAMGIMSCFPTARILFLVHTLSLLTQTVEEFKKFGFNPKVTAKGKYEFGRVVVASRQTLIRADVEEYRDEFDMVILDEAHHLNSFKSEYATILSNMGAIYRYGITATPPSDREAQLVTTGLLGQVIDEVSIDEGIEKGFLAKPKIKILKAPYVHALKYLSYVKLYDDAVVNNDDKNKMIADFVKEQNSAGKSCLILVNRVLHGKKLNEIIPKSHFVYGGTEDDLREEIKQKLEDKTVMCVIATTVWKEGINIKSIDMIINAGGGKSEITTLQSLGRGLRVTDTKKEVLLVDIFDNSNHFLVEHFGLRLCLYSDMGWL
jgi:hypothetical protein